MPNWCYNRVELRHSTPELMEWLREGFSFERMNPAKVLESTGDEARDSWLLVQSQIDAWGTKWDLTEKEQQDVADLLKEGEFAYFATAWTPPLKALEELSRRFPQSEFEIHYYEPGNMFAGRAVFSEGLGENEYEGSDWEAIKQIGWDIFEVWDEDEDGGDDEPTTEKDEAGH
jgi:hypothetical protein